MSKHKEAVTAVEIRHGIVTHRRTSKEIVEFNERGQKFAVIDGLRYRLDEFNEYEWVVGAPIGHVSEG